jgi:hypothetical protein
MWHFTSVLGWVTLVAAALLILLGLSAWPPGGPMFALPFVFLLPGAVLAVAGGILIFLGRQRHPRGQSDPGEK